MRDRQCALNHDATESAAIVSGVINKPTTVELCISPEARSVAQTPAAPGRRSVHCHMPPAACKTALLTTPAKWRNLRRECVFSLKKVGQLLCVGRDEQ